MYISIGIFALAVLGNLNEPDNKTNVATSKPKDQKQEAQREKEAGDGGRQRLQEAMSRFEASPCTSVLQLKNLWAMGGWVLTCEGCAGVPADRIFNKAMLRLADDMTVKGKRLYVRDMYKAAGQGD